MMRLSYARLGALAAIALPLCAFAATPRLDDYARGIGIETPTQRPIVQLDMPDVVYRTVATNNLSDVRVFNADGVPVPHALCVAPQSEAPTISQQSLAVYRLQDLPVVSRDGTRIEVQTPSGQHISVQGQELGAAATAAYVIDAREVSDELRAVQFDWSSPDGASEVRVSIQASEDLDRWRTLVARTTLVQLGSGARQLRRHRIAIPQAQYHYLRIERVDRGPALQLDSVIAERVTPAQVIEPMWFNANAAANRDATGNAYEFDSLRRAPVTFARLVPTQENMSLQVAIESRADPKATWTPHWAGEVYSILNESERRVSPPAQFAPTTNRHWRVRLTKPGDAFYQTPILELGYRPARLRFLAQGAGPYTLAFGSRRAEAAPVRECDNLLGNLPREELEQNIEPGYAGTERALGGDDAFRPLPTQTPLRQIVLWGVLVLGVGALIAMALSLLRRIKPDGTT